VGPGGEDAQSVVVGGAFAGGSVPGVGAGASAGGDLALLAVHGEDGFGQAAQAQAGETPGGRFPSASLWPVSAGRPGRANDRLSGKTPETPETPGAFVSPFLSIACVSDVSLGISPGNARNAQPGSRTEGR